MLGREALRVLPGTDPQVPSNARVGYRSGAGVELRPCVGVWYDAEKGFGWITVDANQVLTNEGTDLFVHHTALSGQRLESGQRVEFTINDGPKGIQAGTVCTDSYRLATTRARAEGHAS
ncbi:Cold shock protein, CspA family [Streptacidiphilus jiangxiensis]|uniref:Cold shock protein, CspA family n=1 Tax=Streptacidiphilus jiangxiensis TaxID=235985 RepID=A0A1H7PCA4_STRJI|nr:Cold shock protein, CspA family [Streptacidiphilus jiangxiensis]